MTKSGDQTEDKRDLGYVGIIVAALTLVFAIVTWTYSGTFCAIPRHTSGSWRSSTSSSDQWRQMPGAVCRERKLSERWCEPH